jgi:DNA invertase Pin-like site-specific DNA recombinase
MQKALKKRNAGLGANATNDLTGRTGLIYARVSSKRQETDGSGLESQENRCLNDLHSLGIPHARTFFDSFSGGGDFMKRPAMKEMLAFIDANPHKKFLIDFDDLKRFARDVEFHFKLRAAFRVRDVALRCLNYNFDESPEGEFAEVVMAGHAQLERKQNRRQVIQKQKARLDAGYWPFSRKRGYTMTKDPVHHMLAVPNEDSRILTAALEGFASGKLVRQVDVARFLVEGGFWKKNRQPEKYLDVVLAILTDPFYAGLVEYLPWEVERRQGRHQGLISPATFEIIQARLQKNNVNVRVRKDTTEDFPMRGLTLCPCGRPYTAAFSKGRHKYYPYYFCHNRMCEFYGKAVPKKDIEDGFTKVLKCGELKPEIGNVMGEVFEIAWKQSTHDLAKQDDRRRKEVDALNEELRSLTDRAHKAQNDRIRLAYEKRMEEIAQTIEDRKQAQMTSGEDHLLVPYRTALDKATQLVKSPYSVWRNMDAHEQHGLYFFLFDERIVYAKNEGYRTAEIPTTARLFEEFVASNSSTVDTSYKTLNRLKTFLRRFWEHYQSSPALRKALS